MTEYIIFDLDGTLAEYKTGVILPNVVDYFKQADDTTHFAIATNQGGVGLRHWMETGGFGIPTKYPTENDVWDYISDFHSRLNGLVGKSINFTYFVSFRYKSKKGHWSPVPEEAVSDTDRFQYWRKDWRKPNSGMLEAAIEHFNADKKDTLMVGDSNEDLIAAHNIGVSFKWANQFFNRD